MTIENNAHPTPTAREKVSVWRWAFRALRWSTYLATLITLILLLHKTPPPAVTTTPQAAARAEEKLQQVEQSASQGQHPTLRLDECELNSYLASHLELAKSETLAAPGGPDAPSAADIEQMRSSVKDVKIQMEGDRVRAYVVFNVHGKDMTLELVGQLAAADGYLKFVPISGQIGSLPIPQSTLETAVQRLMESPENREKLKLPPDIADMHIENGELVATYHEEQSVYARVFLVIVVPQKIHSAVLRGFARSCEMTGAGAWKSLLKKSKDASLAIYYGFCSTPKDGQ